LIVFIQFWNRRVAGWKLSWGTRIAKGLHESTMHAQNFLLPRQKYQYSTLGKFAMYLANFPECNILWTDRTDWRQMQLTLRKENS